MSRFGPILTLSMLAAILWWYRGIAADYAMFGGTLAFGLDVAASLATAIVCVVLLGDALVGFGIAIRLGAQPTGFERAGIYALLGVIALGVILSHFGVNVTAVLATSAVLTAIVGLALQTTLGALVAGFTLQADRVLRIGDAVVQNNEPWTVTGIGWRSVSGVRPDGTRVIMSNSRMLDGAIDVLPRDAPMRREISVLLPLAVQPRRIGALVEEILADLVLIDVTRPISVEPIAFDPERAQARYRIRYWIVGFEPCEEPGEQLLGRLWYGFQREGIAWPVANNYLADYLARLPDLAAPPWLAAIEHAVAAMPAGHDLDAETVRRSGTLLLFDDGERMVLPDRVEGCRCLLIAGRLLGVPFDPANASRRDHRFHASRQAALQRMSASLADQIGPFAEIAVQRAASGAADLADIRTALAEELDDTATRAAFLSQVTVPAGKGVGPGFLFDLRRGAGGGLQPERPLHCDGAVAVVAVPGPMCGTR